MAESFLKSLQLAGTSFLAVALLSGCSTYVPLVYTPQINVKPVTGAGAVTVRVEVTDARPVPAGEIGAVKDDWGIKTSTILTTNDVPGFLKGVLETELTQRGFNPGGSNVLVRVELNDFSSYFSVVPPVLSGGNVSGRVSMDVHVQRADASQVFEKPVVGEFSEGNVSYFGTDRVRYGLDNALQDAMTKLFNDEAFIASLLSAAKP